MQDGAEEFHTGMETTIRAYVHLLIIMVAFKNLHCVLMTTGDDWPVVVANQI